jgi:hypothetical protein
LFINLFSLSTLATRQTTKKQALLVWLKKYNVNNFGTPISMCGMITRLENPEVTFENGETIYIYSL